MSEKQRGKITATVLKLYNIDWENDLLEHTFSLHDPGNLSRIVGTFSVPYDEEPFTLWQYRAMPVLFMVLQAMNSRRTPVNRDSGFDHVERLLEDFARHDAFAALETYKALADRVIKIIMKTSEWNDMWEELGYDNDEDE